MLKHGILGLLVYGDKTGYEIMDWFKNSLNYFWIAQTSQIYRELQTLEKKGFVKSTTIIQKEKPDKNVFSITNNGYEELQIWLEKKENLIYVKRPILMKVFFMGEQDKEKSIQFFTEIKQDCERYLSLLKPVAKHFKNLNDEMKYRALYWEMTQDYGLRCMQMTLEWADTCLKKLEEF